MSFFPLDRKILQSSIYLFGTPTEWKVWTHLLLTADPRTGVVEAPVWLLARDTNLTEEDVEAALRVFERPDTRSRTKEAEGRKIERRGDKILLLNYLAHRDKDHSTPRTRRWRERKRTVGNGRERRSTVTGTTDTDTDTDTTPSTAGSAITPVPVAAPPASPKPPSWSREACDDWIERFEGVAPGGPIGRHLKPLVDKHGWPAVRAAWKAYLEQTEVEFASPAAFAQKFGLWKRPAPAPPAAEEPLPPPDAAAFHFFEGMKVRLSGIMPRNVHATWMRPTYGRAWLDLPEGKCLLLTVPSQQFAEQMRSFGDRLRAAANDMGVTNCLFKVRVVQDQELLRPHDGSIR